MEEHLHIYSLLDISQLRDFLLKALIKCQFVDLYHIRWYLTVT